MAITESPPPALLAWLARNRTTSAYALLTAAALALAGTIFVGVKYGWGDMLLHVVALASFAALLGFAGLWQLLRTPDTADDLPTSRLVLLLAGGGGGLLVALYGFAWALEQRTTLINLVKSGVGETTEPMWVALGCVSAVFVGLFVAFISVQSNQSEERNDPVLRRVLYGYNTALTSLLLLLIIVAGNVLAYAALPNLIDFTKTGVNSLDPNGPAGKIVRALERPVTVYTVLRGEESSLAPQSTRILLQNLRELAGPGKIEIVTLPPDPRDPKVKEVMKKYGFTEAGVLIVTQGTPEQHTFIRETDLWQPDMSSPGGRGGDKYVGEQKVLSELAFLADDKSKPVVYFTQGHGELDLNDSNASADRYDVGTGLLKQRLEKRNVEVKPLKFEVGKAAVPDDATAVVMVGPRLKFTPEQVDALRAYLKPPAASTRKPGKLLLFLSSAVENGHFADTGLGGLLNELGVDAPEQRILQLQRMVNVNGQIIPADGTSPASIVVYSDDRGGTDKSLVEPFLNGLSLYEARVVKPAEGGSAPGSPKAAVLLSTVQDVNPAFADTALNTPELESAYQAFRDVAARKRLEEFSKPVSAAVTVSAGEGKDARPRAVVVGSVLPASNAAHRSNSKGHFQLVAGSIDWLRERPTFDDIAPRTRETVTLEGKNAFGSLPWQPLGLMLVSVAALGGGVWIVRRR